MGLLDKLFGKTETRANPENPSTNLSNPDTWLYTALGASPSVAGPSVTPENSLELSAVWAAVNIIARTLAALPLPVYRASDKGKEKSRAHPLYRLLHDRPNPEMSSFTFREVLVGALLLYGNAYAELERDGAGRIIAMWPIHPALFVRTERVNGKKVQVFRGNNGRNIALVVGEDVLHIPGFGLDGHGLIPTYVARNALGLAKATEAYGSAFFLNSGTPSGILTTPNQLTAEQRTALRAAWSGGATNAQRTAVVDNDVKFLPISLPPEHAQFLQTRTFAIQEVARLFQIPVHKLSENSRSTFSNIEQQSIEFVTNCIMPWCRRIEQELNYVLFPDAEYFAEFQLTGLLRGDTASQTAHLSAMLDRGVYSVNEARAFLNMNTVEDGDDRYRPLNMAKLGENPQVETSTDAADRALIEEAVTRGMEALNAA